MANSFVWLSDFLSRAEALFLYQAVALWCKAEHIDSLEALLQSDWREQQHMRTLLSLTRDRLIEVGHMVLLQQEEDPTLTSAVDGKPNGSSSTGSNLDEKSIFPLLEAADASGRLDVDEPLLSVTSEMIIYISHTHADSTAIATAVSSVPALVGFDTVDDRQADVVSTLHIRTSPRQERETMTPHRRSLEPMSGKNARESARV